MQWINIKERYPAIDQAVWGWDGKAVTPVIYRKGYGGILQFDGMYCCKLPVRNIKFWTEMLIPNKPEETRHRILGPKEMVPHCPQCGKDNKEHIRKKLVDKKDEKINFYCLIHDYDWRDEVL